MTTDDVMKLIYLASPYSHPDPAVQQLRFEQVCKAAAEMMRTGLAVFSPIAHTHPIACAGELPGDWRFWERYDRAMLNACTELVVLKLDGWHVSKGVTAEVEIARGMNKRVSYLDYLW
jgi:hypothetical protein